MHESIYINVKIGKLKTILLRNTNIHSNILKKNGNINNRKLRIVVTLERRKGDAYVEGLKEGSKA